MSNVVHIKEVYKVVSTHKCETVHDLVEAVVSMIHKDPRGPDTAGYTAVHIDNNYVYAELREFVDGTRELCLCTSDNKSVA